MMIYEVSFSMVETAAEGSHCLYRVVVVLMVLAVGSCGETKLYWYAEFQSSSSAETKGRMQAYVFIKYIYICIYTNCKNGCDVQCKYCVHRVHTFLAYHVSVDLHGTPAISSLPLPTQFTLKLTWLNWRDCETDLTHDRIGEKVPFLLEGLCKAEDDTIKMYIYHVYIYTCIHECVYKCVFVSLMISPLCSTGNMAALVFLPGMEVAKTTVEGVVLDAWKT